MKENKVVHSTEIVRFGDLWNHQTSAVRSTSISKKIIPSRGREWLGYEVIIIEIWNGRL